MFIYENGKKKLVCGTVSSVMPVTVGGQTKTAVKVVDRQGDEVTVIFSDKLVERVEKAKVREGVFITILCEMVTENAGNGLEFKFKGWWYLDSEYNGKPTHANIFVGTITSPKRVSEKCFSVTMPIDSWNKETKTNDTVWQNIRFVNKNADFAEKLLGSGNHYGAIVCGDRQSTKAANGNTYYHFFGGKVELRLNNKTEE